MDGKIFIRKSLKQWSFGLKDEQTIVFNKDGELWITDETGDTVILDKHGVSCLKRIIEEIGVLSIVEDNVSVDDEAGFGGM